MEVLAAPERKLAWVCPECGHGSTEPRDQRAHLDAHRQLRQFIEAWDADAAADRAAEDRRRRLRPFVALAVALVVLLLGTLAVRGVGHHDVVQLAPALPALPAPGAPAPGVPTPPSVPPGATPSAPAVQAPPATPAPAAPAVGVQPSSPAPAGGGQTGSGELPSPSAPPATATTIPPATSVPPPTGLLRIHTCLVGICVDLGV